MSEKNRALYDGFVWIRHKTTPEVLHEVLVQLTYPMSVVDSMVKEFEDYHGSHGPFDILKFYGYVAQAKNGMRDVLVDFFRCMFERSPYADQLRSKPYDVLYEGDAERLKDLINWHKDALELVSKLGYHGLTVTQVLACQDQEIKRLTKDLQEERESARDFLQEHYELQARMRVVKANQPDPENLYTCIGKGGVYEALGASIGAGEMRNTTLTIYRDIKSGEMYHRTHPDFRDRMCRIKCPAVIPTAEQIKEALEKALEERNRPHYGDNRGDWVHLTIEETQRAVSALVNRLNEVSE